MLAFARLLSILLHPIVMPVLSLWLVLEVDPAVGYFITGDRRWFMLGMVALMTIAFPLTSTLLLQRTGLITSLEMPLRRERIAPYVLTLVYYGLAYYLLRQAPLHPAAHALFLGAIVALALTTLITLAWKISAHMVGFGGLLGAVMGVAVVHALPLLPVVAALVLVAGLLGTARLLASDHTQGQIVSGVLLGWCCTWGAVVAGWTI